MTAQDFWSRRRAAVEREEQAQLAAVEQAKETEAREELEAKPDAEILAELNLPDPDTLKAGDDFTAFMSKAVPDRIRRRALRVLWKANPILANLDELVEYGENYTDSATVVENMQTAYQVGRGMLKHIESLAEKADEQAIVAEEDTPVDEPAPEVEAEPIELAVSEPTADLSEPDEIAQLRPRRMKFRVEETA